MKLAFCIVKYFPYGGLQKDFLQIAAACAAQGHHIDVYTTQWSGIHPSWLHLITVPVKGLSNHRRVKNFVNQALAMIDAANYDLVIGFNRMPGLDWYYAGDVCFAAKYQQRPFARLTSRYKVFQQLEQAVFSPSAATQILCLSQTELESYHQIYHTPLERLHLLPPGVSAALKRPENAEQLRAKTRQNYAINDDEFLLLFIASAFKTKGLDRALNALASCAKNCKLWIIGDGKADKYQKLIKKLKIQHQVKFFGAQDNVLPFLLAADLLVHPARCENTGTVLLEALVSGLPILTTDICGYAKHIVKAQSGLLIPSPFKQSKMNTLLAEMLKPQQLKLWQQNAITYAHNNDLYNLVQQAVRLITK